MARYIVFIFAGPCGDQCTKLNRWWLCSAPIDTKEATLYNISCTRPHLDDYRSQRCHRLISEKDVARRPPNKTPDKLNRPVAMKNRSISQSTE